MSEIKIMKFSPLADNVSNSNVQLNCQLSTDTWYRGMNRSERIRILLHALEAQGATRSDKLVESRMKKHLEIFDVLRKFGGQLSIDMGMSREDEFKLLECVSTKDIQACCPQSPPWLSEFIEAFLNEKNSSLPPLHKLYQGSEQMFGFLNAFSPVLIQGLMKLKQGLNDMAGTTQHGPFIATEITESLFRQVLLRVANLINRTMVLELNVARLQGNLSGKTPEERFMSFVERISEPSIALEILQEYPVLCRQVVIAVRQWVDNNLELMKRLCNDWQLVLDTFNLVESEAIVRIGASSGDSHQNGRAVAVLVFGSGFKLVYKPRSMAIDVHFQELLEWVNQRGDYPTFKTIKIIDRGSYGWSEFVEAKPCSTRDELERFYERQGRHLALLYVLNATDFHWENLIASGEHPILIDLESLFHVKPVQSASNLGVTDLANEVLSGSVMSVGLLPRRMWGDANQQEGLDVSGLGGAGGQMTPFRVPAWAGVGTDEMRFERQYVRLPGNKNRPALDQQEVDILEFADSILKGFKETYSLLVRCRKQLLSKSSPIEQFRYDEIRHIARPTRFYGMFLADSFHPDLLRDALDRDAYFDHLQDDLTHRLEIERLVQYESEDLWKNDIPFFTSRPGSRDLLSSTKEVIKDYFKTTSIDIVKQQLRNLNDEDCTQQCWLIRSSLTALAMGEPTASWKSYNLKSTKSAVTRARLVQAARKVGDRLVELAFRDRDKKEATWIGLSLLRERFWHIAPMNLGLYDGVAGVALFLAYLGVVTNEPTYTNVSKEATFYIKKQWQHYGDVAKKSPEHLVQMPIGAYSHSPVSAIYLLTHLGQLWHREELLLEAESLVETLPALVMRDEGFDIISGAAGCIKALLNLQSIQPSDQTVEVALKCGNLLLERAMPMTIGKGWKTMLGSEQPLAGFSHGAAGIAWALMQLGHHTGESCFIDCAKDAIAYERMLYDPKVGNWIDLRENPQGNQSTAQEAVVGQPRSLKSMNAWCHGAPGIGLSRLDLMKYGYDPEIESEVNVAIRTTQESGFGLNHSLCHGDLGNLELLFNAAKTFGDSALEEKATRILGGILDSAEQHGWLCGVPLGVETPGLMTGISGIGYQLLRFAASEQVPSVLLLEPPFMGN